MSETGAKPHAAVKWGRLGAVAAVCTGIAGAVVFLRPDLLHLMLLGLYEIPCQLISLPVEPYQLYVSKFHDAWTVTLILTVACTVGGVMDYWLFEPLLHHGAVKPHYENNRLFKTALKYFQKAPFLTLTFTGYTPVPFFPFKLLAIAAGYPMRNYVAALLLARIPRYYLVSYVGYMLQPPTWTLVALAVAAGGAYLFTHWKRRRYERRRQTAPAPATGLNKPGK